MNDYTSTLSWIADQSDQMIDLLSRWCSINSNSYNPDGLSRMLQELKQAFSPLDADMKEVSLPPQTLIDSQGNKQEQPLGVCLSLRKRPTAPIQVFLGGHMDTVFPADDPFQTVLRLDEKCLYGPGAADMKGGLIIMLKALEAFEQSSFRDQIGWEVFINSDEEIASPGSASFLQECAHRNHFGLIFEPSLPDGTWISERKGSANFTIVAKGKAAHVGRDFSSGSNAIVALCRVIDQIDRFNDASSIINIGQITGGAAVNIVPELALCHCNLRTSQQEQMDTLRQQIEEAVAPPLQIHWTSSRPPKVFDKKTEMLFQRMKECGELLDMKNRWKPSGGVCDGNILAHEGLPTIDTLGARGDGIHTHEEYLLTDSLTTQAQLTALFLMKLILN